MKNIPLLLILILAVSSSGCMRKLMQVNPVLAAKTSEFQQIDFQELMKRYMSKEITSGPGDIEGIYSVSIVVEKKSTPLFGGNVRERVVERKNNYATVAILRDRHSGREFMEVSLDKPKLPSYSVRGEFSAMNDANILVYKHFESKGKSTTYTFSFDKTTSVLEGIRTEVDGRAEFTYKITYLKLQGNQATAENN